ncbi:MAG: RDD family protein [Candidatus Obscuribacter sp.]|nr:RDD family protein [Candidatus Obscuribacter sp.]
MPKSKLMKEERDKIDTGLEEPQPRLVEQSSGDDMSADGSDLSVDNTPAAAPQSTKSAKAGPSVSPNLAQNPFNKPNRASMAIDYPYNPAKSPGIPGHNVEPQVQQDADESEPALSSRLASHLIDAGFIAIVCTIIYVCLGITWDLVSQTSFDNVLGYLYGLPKDIQSGLFPVDAIFAKLLAVFIIFFINAVFPGCICMLAFFALLGNPDVISQNDLSPRFYLIAQIVFFSIPVFYHAFFLTLYGVTPGKKIFGLKVQKLSLGHALLRESLKLFYIDFVLSWWYPLRAIVNLVRPKASKLALALPYDRLAGTKIYDGSSVSRHKALATIVWSCGLTLTIGLVYVGLLKEPIADAMLNSRLSYLERTDKDKYLNKLVKNLKYRKRSFYQNQSEANRLRLLTEDITTYEHALALLKKSGGTQKSLSPLYAQLAVMCEERSLHDHLPSEQQRDLANAAAYFESYISLRDAESRPLENDWFKANWEQSNVLYELSEIYLKLERYKDAETISRRAIDELTKEDKYKTLPFVYYVLIRSFERQNMPAEQAVALIDLCAIYRGYLDQAITDTTGKSDSVKREKIMPLYTDLFSTELRLADRFYSQNRVVDAQEHLDKARKLYDQYGQGESEDGKVLKELTDKIVAGKSK